MQDEMPRGEIVVELDRQDVMQLLQHGRASKIKSIGPLDIRIKTDEKLRPAVMVDSHHEDAEEVSN